MRSSLMPCYGSPFCSIQISTASSAWPCNSYLRTFNYVRRFGCVPRSCSVMMRSCRGCGCGCGYFGTLVGGHVFLPQKKRFAILGQQVECSEWSN